MSQVPPDSSLTPQDKLPKLKMMAIRPPFKIAILFSIGILLILGGFWIFNNKLPLTKKSDTTTLGQVFGLRSQVPAEFPSDIPLFEKAIIRSTTKSNRQVNVVLETEAAAEEPLQFYKNAMAQNGWEAIETFKPEGGEAWVFSKGDRHLELIVVRNEEEGKTLIFLKTNAS